MKTKSEYLILGAVFACLAEIKDISYRITAARPDLYMSRITAVISFMWIAFYGYCLIKDMKNSSKKGDKGNTENEE